MDRLIKIALLFSMLLNLLFLVLGIFSLAKRGGIPYLFKKISSLIMKESYLIPMNEIPYYVDKVSHFSNLTNTDPEIIFLGDSITDYCEWSELFGNHKIKNRGISGDRTDGILNRLDEILQAQPQKIFLMVGINDLIQGREICKIFTNYKIIVLKIKHKLPDTKLFIQSVLPINNLITQKKLFLKLNNNKVIEFNAKLQDLAKEFSLPYIDLFAAFADSYRELDERYTTDGVHLNGEAYLLWEKIIEKDVVD
ncbi:MAG: GDSL-type esterase/lipase family protein [Potamolinea sp.]